MIVWKRYRQVAWPDLIGNQIVFPVLSIKLAVLVAVSAKNVTLNLGFVMISGA